MGKSSRKRRDQRKQQKPELVAAMPYGQHPSEDAASALDRRWFEEHPGAKVRVRPRLPGEVAPGDPALQWVIVRQLQPGMRTRNLTEFVPPAGITLFDSETGDEIEEWQIQRDPL